MRVVRTRPDILVLGAGGMLDEAWMAGVLAGIEDATGFDMRRCEYFVGTSAGSLLAARLAAGQPPDRPPDDLAAGRRARPPEGAATRQPAASANAPATQFAPGTPSANGAHKRLPGAAPMRLARRTAEWALALGSPLAPATLGMIEPGGALARAMMLRVIPESTDTPVRVRQAATSIKASFDGRLRIVAVERRRGRRTVFGQPGAPVATVTQAVEASCAVPWMYAPVRIAGRDYVDGSFWSPTNLDVAPAHRGTQVLCLNPIAGLPGPHPALTLAREGARARMLLEAQALRGQGALVRLVSPDANAVRELSRSARGRGPHTRAVTAGYLQGLALARSSPPRAAAPLPEI
ncbi:MAG: patatin-like phospholipase family protein [Solirubrobacteraceae bacterium]